MEKKDALYWLSGFISDAVDDWEERKGSIQNLIDATETLSEREISLVLKNELDIASKEEGLESQEQIEPRVIDDSFLYKLEGYLTPELD